MNSNQKSKKGGPDEDQIRQTIDIVKQYWPDYPITSAEMRNPNSNFVLKYYKDCVGNLESRITAASRTRPLPNVPWLCEEEILYLKLCKIPTLEVAQIKLADLYVFQPKRLFRQMFITMHFLIASESQMDNMFLIFDEAFNLKDKFQSLEKKLNEVKEDKIQAQIDLTLTSTELKKDKELAAAQIHKYEQTLNLIQISEAKCKDSILEAERLRNLEKNLQEEIQKLEDSENALKSKVFPEDECESLKAICQSLEKHLEDSEEDEQVMDLLKQKEQCELAQNCIEEAKHLELENDVFKLSKQREEFKNITKDVEHMRAIQENTESDLAQMQKALESQLQLLEEDIKLTEKDNKKNTEKKLTEEAELKKQKLKVIQENLNQIEDLKSVQSQVESDCIMLKSGLSEQILKISNMHRAHVANFHRFLSKAEGKMMEMKEQ